MKSKLLVCLMLGASGAVVAEPATYTVDADHTHPSFETDHFGGLSVWRGIFGMTTGKITLDRAASTGTVDVTVDTTTIDFAHSKMNEHAKGKEMLDVATYPTATFKGKLGDFKNGSPTTVTGELTLHGVTKPLTLQIDSFKCMNHPMRKKEVCGADAQGKFNRADFGVSYGQQMGFKQDVLLRIQVEALKD